MSRPSSLYYMRSNEEFQVRQEQRERGDLSCLAPGRSTLLSSDLFRCYCVCCTVVRPLQHSANGGGLHGILSPARLRDPGQHDLLHALFISKTKLGLATEIAPALEIPTQVNTEQSSVPRTTVSGGLWLCTGCCVGGAIQIWWNGSRDA